MQIVSRKPSAWRIRDLTQLSWTWLHQKGRVSEKITYRSSVVIVMFKIYISPQNTLYWQILLWVYLHSLSYSLYLFAFLGGGYLSGAGAQEENLFHCTNYMQHLADPETKFDPTKEWKYWIPEFSCIYSKNVFIIRASEAEGYKFLANPVPMSSLALPAYSNPALTKDKNKLIPVIAENTKHKICCMLSAGLYYGHDSLVLSALGCGAFRNPASHMAQLFKDVLSEGRFANRYKHISFAILDDHNARGDGNFKPFLEVFADCT